MKATYTAIATLVAIDFTVGMFADSMREDNSKIPETKEVRLWTSVTSKNCSYNLMFPPMVNNGQKDIDKICSTLKLDENAKKFAISNFNAGFRQAIAQMHDFSGCKSVATGRVANWFCCALWTTLTIPIPLKQLGEACDLSVQQLLKNLEIWERVMEGVMPLKDTQKQKIKSLNASYAESQGFFEDLDGDF